LLLLDQMPAVHVPKADVRAWRSAIEYRRRMVDDRTQVKNRLRALLRGQGIVAVKGLWTKKGLAWLREQPLDTWLAIQREDLLDQLERLNERLRKLTQALDQQGKANAGVGLLRTIPGVGPRTAEAVVAYLDDVKRFGRVKQVASYFGLVPCQDASAARNRLGHITKQGPATVRKLLVEAAWQGIRRSPTMKGYFERVGKGDPGRRKIALTATAHYLVRVMVGMLRSGETWEEHHARPASISAVTKSEAFTNQGKLEGSNTLGAATEVTKSKAFTNQGKAGATELHEGEKQGHRPA
jgi:transposase